jgi:hypothetical protein
VIATLDERTYDPGDGAMGADHPISWWHAYDGGRAWYTALGHTDSTYSEPLFLGFLLGGIRYAAAPPGPLEIVSLSATVSRGRLNVAVEVTGCAACSGSAHLGRVSGKLRFTDGTGTGVLSHLTPGRGRVFVVVRDAETGATKSTSRPVRIR